MLYKNAKRLITSKNYDKETMTITIGTFAMRGLITQDELAELLDLMNQGIEGETA